MEEKRKEISYFSIPLHRIWALRSIGKTPADEATMQTTCCNELRCFHFYPPKDARTLYSKEFSLSAAYPLLFRDILIDLIQFCDSLRSYRISKFIVTGAPFDLVASDVLGFRSFRNISLWKLNPHNHSRQQCFRLIPSNFIWLFDKALGCIDNEWIDNLAFNA